MRIKRYSSLNGAILGLFLLQIALPYRDRWTIKERQRGMKRIA